MFKKGLSFGAGVSVMLLATALVYAVASYPTSVKSFTTKNTNDTIQAAHINDLQDEVVAIEGGLLNGVAHDLKPSTDNARDLGTSALNFRDLWLSGEIDLGGGQIAFPATQAASTGANTLDDYEEGSWTPSIGGTTSESGQVYSIQVGRYVKIGQLVHVQGRVKLSTLGTITGSVQIEGLPFTSNSATDSYSTVTVGHFDLLTTSLVWLGGFIRPSVTVIELRALTAAATTVTTLAQADLSNTSDIIFSAHYRASQ